MYARRTSNIFNDTNNQHHSRSLITSTQLASGSVAWFYETEKYKRIIVNHVVILRTFADHIGQY